MTSKLILYYNSLIEKDKNFILDHWVSSSNRNPDAILLYLNTLTKETINDFQYVKHGLSISIKIDKSQTALNMGSGADVKDLNYISIQNGNEKVYYYFVISKNWKSQNTIELVLSMDTLNTFMYDADYTINNKTFIKRQHKDRFTKLSGTHIMSTYFAQGGTTRSIMFTDIRFANSMPKNMSATLLSGSAVINSVDVYTYNYKKYIRVSLTSTGEGTAKVFVSYQVESLLKIIDLKSEEINVPVYKVNEMTLYENKGTSSIDWSLYYKNSSNQENAPIDCYLVPSEAMSLYYQQASGELNHNNVPNGKYLIFSSTYPSGELTFKWDNTSLRIREYSEFDETGYVLLAVYNDNGTIKVYSGTIRDNLYIGQEARWTLVHSGNINIENSPEYVYAYMKASLPTASSWYGGEYLPAYATTQINMGALVQSTLYGNNSIDKTLESNIKIINLPYSPTPFSVDSNGIYTFDECWTYNSTDGKLKLTDFTKRFDNEVETAYGNIMENFFYNTYQQINLDQDASRGIPDPKLDHSDFTRIKFVYDSFGKIFPLEQVDYTASNKDDFNFKFEFIMSRNIVSKFLFKFNQIKYNNSVEDYDNILPVSRNNEEVLYNSQYLDYIRTGYNYDLKAKERQEVASGVGIGLNVAGLLASIGIGMATQNPIAIGSAVASGIGLVSQLVGYAKNTAQNEENIQRKLQETQMQAISVRNADDYDLLYAYSNNKAKIVRYECSTRMRRVLDDLFYYCGYVHNEQGKPSIHTRRSFNFVQATLEIDHSTNLTNEILEDIKEKFENGVTFLHYSFNKFDFAQDKENIELSVL